MHWTWKNLAPHPFFDRGNCSLKVTTVTQIACIWNNSGIDRFNFPLINLVKLFKHYLLSLQCEWHGWQAGMLTECLRELCESVTPSKPLRTILVIREILFCQCWNIFHGRRMVTVKLATKLGFLPRKINLNTVLRSEKESFMP